MSDWVKLTDEMQAYIDALQRRITELTQELAEELEKNPSVGTTLRIAQIQCRNLQVTLQGGKPDAQKAEQR